MTYNIIQNIKGAEARDNYRFTCGDCHILAKRIAKVTGWDLCTFVDEEGDPFLHAFVRMPDGNILDVNGVQTEEAFRQHWQAPAEDPSYRIGTWTWSGLRASTWWTSPTFGRYSYARARIIAGKLLDQLSNKE